jgi:hypothetical protein
VDVPILDTEVAAEFLINRTGDPDRHLATRLAVELGGLPLALEQAAAYMQATGDTLTEYLTLLRQRRADILARGEPIGYGKTVATTLSVAFNRLQQASPGAVGLLRLLAFCTPEAIPLRMLSQSRPGLAGHLSPSVQPLLAPLLEDSLAAKDAIAELRKHSLISRPIEGLVSIHRLVQAVIIDQMPPGTAAEWRQATSLVIEAGLIAKIKPLMVELQQHVMHIMQTTAPDDNHAAETYDRVVYLFSLIVREVLPSRKIISQAPSASSSLPDLDNVLDSLQQSSEKALVAISTYTATLKNERRQQERGRRSVKRYADDQHSLMQLQSQAIAGVAKLIEALEDFIKILS